MFKLRQKISAWIFLLWPAIGMPFTPPYFTGTPEPTEYQYWEAYLYGDIDNPKDSIMLSAPTIEIDYGLLPNVMLHSLISLNATLQGRSMGSSGVGIGDIELGVLYRFIQETSCLPQVGFYPLVDLPTGDSSRNLGNGKTWWQLPLWFQKSWDPWILDWGGGYLINPATTMKNFWYGSVLLQRKITEALIIGAEFYAQGRASQTQGALMLLNAGVTYNIQKNFQFLFSVGNTISGPQDLFVNMGLYWKFKGA